MELTFLFVVVGLVTLYSIFSFVSARGWTVSSEERNDLVFEHRNKEYGAYQIRKNYNKRLALIMLGMLLAFGVGAGVLFVIRKLEENAEGPKRNENTVALVPPPLPEDVPPPPPPPNEPPPPPPPPLEELTAFIPPVIEDDPVTDPIPTQKELENANIDTKNQEGTKDFLPEDDGNFEEVPVQEEKPKEIEQAVEPVETFVEEEAEFPGGAGAMAKYINENIDYPQEAIDLGIKGRVMLRFVVEKDGRISNVSVVGSLAGCKACDKSAVQVVEKMPAWKTGKNGGRSVRTWVTLPIKFEVN